MNVLQTVLIIILGTSLAGLIIWLAILFFRESEDKFDENFIFNFLPQYSTPVKGHAVGLEVNTKVINNRYLIEYLPGDFDNKMIKDKIKINNVKVAIDKNKVITLPKGTLSSYRTIKLLLPPNPEDFSTELKHTHFGQMLMKMTEEINTSNVEAKIVREGSDRKTKLLTELGDGEISEAFLERQSELQKELDKRVDRDTKTTPGTQFKPPTF